MLFSIYGELNMFQYSSNKLNCSFPFLIQCSFLFFKLEGVGLDQDLRQEPVYLIIIIIIKKINKNTTLLEHLHNPIQKSQKKVKSIFFTCKYMTANFPGLLQALQYVTVLNQLDVSKPPSQSNYAVMQVLSRCE